MKILRRIFKKLWFWRGISRRNNLVFTIATIIIVLIAVGAIYRIFTPTGSEAAWWNGDWDYRAAIPVTAHTSDESNVYVSVTIADTDDLVTAGKLQADCGDFRFVDNNGNILPYYISSGCNSASNVVHILL
jgi:hypothetical protein